jgi:hypothetical protein
MPTKITAMFDNPADPVVFEAGWADGLVELAKTLPGVQRVESARVWPKEDGSPTPAYRSIDMYFADYDAASAAVTSAQAGQLFPKLAELGSAGVKFVFFDVNV